MNVINSFEIENEVFYFYDINKLLINYPKLRNLPKVLKILFELNIRNAKNEKEFQEIINIFLNRNQEEIKFYPSRIVMEDFEALLTFSDLATIRDLLKSKNEDIDKINPKIMIDILMNNLNQKDGEENKELIEKYSFIKWSQHAFKNIRVVPPNCFENNEFDLNYLSTILHLEKKDDKFFLYPESILSIETSKKEPNKNRPNSFGILDFTIDNIKSKTAIFGNEISINLPKVVGVKIHMKFEDDILEEDSIIEKIGLSLENKLNSMSLKGKVLEFYGNGLKYLNITHRKNILKLCSKYEMESSFFAIDEETISYLNRIKENEDYGKLIKLYLEKQGLFYQKNEQIDFDEIIDIDLQSLENSILDKNIFNENIFNENIHTNDIALENIFKGNDFWQNLDFKRNDTYTWDENSNNINFYNKEYLELFEEKELDNIEETNKIDIQNAGILALFKDLVKSEYISPLENISLYSPAAKYLESKGVKSFEYNTFLSRSANPNVMVRSIFDSSYIKNNMLTKEGSFTIDYRNGEIVSIFDKAQRFKEISRPLVIFAGKDFGSGNFREWASKGIRLLGVKAIIAKSFDERYRLNLVACGILPLEFIDDDIESLKLKGNETLNIEASEIKINSKVDVFIEKENINIEIKLKLRLDTKEDVEVYLKGGIYPFLLNSIRT